MNGNSHLHRRQPRAWQCRLSTIIVSLAAILAQGLRAEVVIPGLFSDHMVLQRSSDTAIWGKASPGEEVTVTLAKQRQTAVADAGGSWKVAFDLEEVGQGPFDLVVTAVNKITFTDVMVGQVWLASGQSNMEWILKDTVGGPEEVERSANLFLRFYTVPKSSVPVPATDCKGQWLVAGPQSSGSFSAVGYYFGQKLQRELREPIGIINASWGGSACEAWLSEQGFDRDASLRAGAEKRWKAVKDYPEARLRYARDLARWLKENKREDHRTGPADFAGESFSPEGWVPVKLPGIASGPGLPRNGAIWFRKEIDLPAQPEGVKFLLEIGEIQGFDGIYWNGKPVLETTPDNYPGAGYWRRAAIASGDLKVGRNVVAIRVFAPIVAPRFLVPSGNFKAGPIPLTGPWLAREEFVLPTLDPQGATPPDAPHNPPRAQDMAAFLYNGMINPLVNFRIGGVIWYQGEANANRAEQYRSTFPRLIEDWRAKWGRGDLPFYHCQLANYLPKKSEPGESAWAELREAQHCSLTLPRTGEAVLIDKGDAGDIHPRNKVEVGERLADLALGEHYGRDIAVSGPTYRSLKTEGSTIRLSFRNIDGGLVAKPLPETHVIRSVTGETAPLIRNSAGSELEGFAICGDDRKWHWAEARIDGETVVVSSPSVVAPTAVRYAWADNPTCNLYNGAGLPASPFRTDDFPSLTRGASY